jgi:hypothetical protein
MGLLRRRVRFGSEVVVGARSTSSPPWRRRRRTDRQDGGVTDSHAGMAGKGLEDQAGGGALRLACAVSQIGLSQVRHQDWPAQEPEGLGDAGDCVQTQSRPTGAPGSHAQRRRDAAAGSVE